LEISMRPTAAITTALLLFLGVGVAEAPDPTQLAETAGFLLGNAYRCGVPAERVDHARKVVHHLIVAASYDSTEEATADARFAEIFIASAVPDAEDALIPPRAAGRAIRTARAASSAVRHELTN
jgi:hypothetical protein